jgi:hypothetical protein
MTEGWPEVHVRELPARALEDGSFQILPGGVGPWEVWPKLFTAPKAPKDTGPKIGDEAPKKQPSRRGGIKIVRPIASAEAPDLVFSFDEVDSDAVDSDLGEGDPDVGAVAAPMPLPEAPAAPAPPAPPAPPAAGSVAAVGMHSKAKQASQSRLLYTSQPLHTSRSIPHFHISHLTFRHVLTFSHGPSGVKEVSSARWRAQI